MQHDSSDALPPCRVCAERRLALFAVIDLKTYWRCAHCQATLLADAHLPTPSEEIARYSQQHTHYSAKLKRKHTIVQIDPRLNCSNGPGPARTGLQLNDACR